MGGCAGGGGLEGGLSTCCGCASPHVGLGRVKTFPHHPPPPRVHTHTLDVYVKDADLVSLPNSVHGGNGRACNNAHGKGGVGVGDREGLVGSTEGLGP
jgi:hypothetical protein